MYTPPANAVDDQSIVLALVRTAGFGHLVNQSEEELQATALPFLVDDTLTTLRAHVARANPHWRSLDGARALMIVPVTDAYVSPGWYPSKADEPRVVPTWNYEVVHVHGTVRAHHDPDAIQSIVRDLTDLHEGQRTRVDASPTRWSVNDAPAAFIERQLRAIVGLEMSIDRVDAKRKLSQNRSDRDHAGVAAGLATSGLAGSPEVADAMRA